MRASLDFVGVDWVDRLDQATLDRFLDLGFLCLDGCFSSDFFEALQREGGLVEYRQAHLTQGQAIRHIRGDGIRWIEADDVSFPVGSVYLAGMLRLGQFFNQALFAGIRRAEAHYACYPAGFGYQWHRDNPSGRDERVISAVFYLNEDWQEQDGGALALVDRHEQMHKILPKGNRLVIFDSDLLHEVQVCHKRRYSIATWLRKDDDVL